MLKGQQVERSTCLQAERLKGSGREGGGRVAKKPIAKWPRGRVAEILISSNFVFQKMSKNYFLLLPFSFCFFEKREAEWPRGQDAKRLISMNLVLENEQKLLNTSSF